MTAEFEATVITGTLFGSLECEMYVVHFVRIVCSLLHKNLGETSLVLEASLDLCCISRQDAQYCTYNWVALFLINNKSKFH